jgi:hypothetical protein
LSVGENRRNQRVRRLIVHKSNNLLRETRSERSTPKTNAKSNEWTGESSPEKEDVGEGERLQRPPLQAVPLRKKCGDESGVLVLPRP